MTDTNDSASVEVEAQDGPRSSKRLLLATVGFGLFLGYCQVLELGLDNLMGISSGSLSTWSSIARNVAAALVLLWYAMLGHLRHYTIRKMSIFGAALLVTFATALYAPFAGTSGEVAMSAFAGFGSGFIALVWALVLSSMPRDEALIATVGGLAVGGLVTLGSRFVGADACLALLSLIALASPLALLAVDPKLVACGPDEDTAGAATIPTPWLSLFLFIACGCAGAILYGSMGMPGVTATLSTPAFVVSLLIVMMACLIGVVFYEQAYQLLWIPPFVLVFVCLVLIGTSGAQLSDVFASLAAGSYFSFQFMKWVVLPIAVNGGRPTRLFSCALLFLLSSNGLWLLAGREVAYALAPVMGPARLPLSLANFVALALLGTVALLFLVTRVMSHDNTRAQASQAPSTTQHDGAGDADTTTAEHQDAQPEPAFSYQDKFAMFAAKQGLTAREQEIALLTARGYSSTRIAEMLIISSSTVRFHQQNLYRKLDVHSRQDYIDLVSQFIESV